MLNIKFVTVKLFLYTLEKKSLYNLQVLRRFNEFKYCTLEGFRKEKIYCTSEIASIWVGLVEVHIIGVVGLDIIV